MPTLSEIRQMPGMDAYSDMSDRQLADAIYRKSYSDMPRDQFDTKIGFDRQAETAGTTAGMALRGVPVLGAYVPQAEAAIRAAAQPLTGVGAPGATWSERYAANLPQREAEYTAAEKAAPITSEALKFAGGTAALAPVAATTAGARALGITGPSLWGRLGAGATSGAALSAADAALRGQDWQTAAGYGAAGGAGGALVGRALEGLPRVITGTRGGAARAADVAALEREGVQLSAGQRTGHRGLQIAEEEAANVLPWGTAPQERAKQTLTQAAARRAGIEAENLRPEVMDQALNNFNTAYRGIAARNDITGVPNMGQLGTDMAETVNRYLGMAGPQGGTAPQQMMGRIVDAIERHNSIPGELYQTIRSELGKQARSALRGQNPNFHLADALHGLQGDLDNAMTRSMAAAGSPDMAAWQQLNRYYKNFLPLERAITGAGEEARQGLLSPMALRQALVSMQGRRSFGRGAGDLAALASAGESVMKGFPQSGTSARRYWAYEAPLAIGAIAHGIGTGNLPMAGAGLLGLIGPPVSATTILSRPVQRYLGGQPTSLPAWASTLGITGAQQAYPGR